MQSLARNGYTAEQVKKALHAPTREMHFRYDLLHPNNRLKKRLRNVVGGTVRNNALAQIKRTANFTLQEDLDINYLADRIKPWARLIMPDRGFVEWSLGVFILSTPPRKTSASGVVIREIAAYDQLQVLIDDKVEDRYTVTEGTNYIEAVNSLLVGAGITNINLTPSSSTFPADRDWDPGTSKLQIINDLLGAINYRSLVFDENGIALAEPYISPADRATEYTYRDDDDSVIFPEVTENLDLFGVPNKWVLVTSEPDREPLISTYTNENPNSPTSTVSRSRTIVDYREIEAANQASLDARAERLAFETSQVYQQVEFDTAIMPFHSDSDVYELYFSNLGIGHKYGETSWEFELKAGARMSHRIRRVVSI